MKSIYVTFEDKEFGRLLKAKGKLSWRNFILLLAKKKKGKNEFGDFEEEYC